MVECAREEVKSIGQQNVVGIYKITNVINGKAYIGQSVNIKKRFNAHRSAVFNPNNAHHEAPLYRAIRKYGIENFKFEIVEECLESELNQKEAFYIALYQTHGPNGYNQDDGGDQASHYIKLSDDLVSEIIDRLKNTMNNSEDIGSEFGVSGRTIRNINAGDCCHRDSEVYPIRESLCKLLAASQPRCSLCGQEISSKATYCVDCGHKILRRVAERPDPLELAYMIQNYGFTGTGKYFHVSGNTIKAWCKRYGMPYKKEELITWYNLNNNKETPAGSSTPYGS